MTEKIKIQEVLVVEGKDDTVNLRRFYDVDTYETRGSAINDEDLERIEKLNNLRGVIVFTDPDYNGERIRKLIMTAVPTAKHAFLNRGEAVPKSKTKGRSLGVEHASFEDLQKALSGVLGNYDDENQPYSPLEQLDMALGKEVTPYHRLISANGRGFIVAMREEAAKILKGFGAKSRYNKIMDEAEVTEFEMEDFRQKFYDSGEAGMEIIPEPYRAGIGLVIKNINPGKTGNMKPNIPKKIKKTPSIFCIVPTSLVSSK